MKTPPGSPMRNLTLLLLALLSIPVLGDQKKPPIGVFSNEAEEFNTVTVMIHEGGLAYFHAALVGMIGEWTLDQESSKLSLRFFNPSKIEYQALDFQFDAKTRTYGIVRTEEDLKKDPPFELRFISDEMPEGMLEAFEAYPETIKRSKAQAIARRESIKRREEQLEKERPEYERFVARIREQPETVLAKEFHSRELTEQGRYPVKIRAFRDTLSDHDVFYPEVVLIELLNEVPDDHHSLRVLLFQRPELSSATLTQFYPQAIEWAELNYTILANLANHPNTPIEIIRDLAGRTDLPVGATNPAKYRLERIKRGTENP
ncbi:MAG: hypothetical protein AAGC68_01300 [Verrucomicrobiota bacterium]